MQPQVTERADQPYVAIRSTVTMQDLGDVLPPLTTQLYDRMAARDLEPAGPCFWKYNVIDMEAELEVEVGVPVAVLPDGNRSGGDDVLMGAVLPGGRYAEVLHVGHPDTLEQATGDLLEWAEMEGLKWDISDDHGDQRWAARLEEYLDDPVEQPDMSAWRTKLIFKLAD